jgi:5'-deoxynucleotidase YfbR-like HD superfamily hydrolase
MIAKWTIVFILVLTLCSAAFAGDDELQGPRMTFTAKDHDFGEIITGDIVEHVYLFTNTGTDTLRIATVYSS